MAAVCTGPGPCDVTPFGEGKNWVTKVGGLPPYIRAIAKALVRNGHTESNAIELAVGTVQRWARGEGNVSAATRARAAAALAEWERKKTQAHALSAHDVQTVDLAWNESLHPRNRGKFAPKGSRTIGAAPKTSSNLPESIRAQIRDFQRREHLPVTGVFDAATKSRIGTLTNPSSGAAARKAASAAKRAARKQAAAARKAARARASAARKKAAQTRHQQALGRASRARTAAAVNRLSSQQRAAYRRRQPTPPVGYTWTADNHLRATGTTAEAQRVATIAGPAPSKTSKPLPFVPGAVRHLTNEEAAVRVIELNGRRFGVIELVTTVVDTNDFPTLSVPALVRQGKALKPLPGTNRPRFPIRNHDDLKKAVKAVGRAKGSHDQVRRYIIKRAKQIGGTHLIPDHWNADGTIA